MPEIIFPASTSPSVNATENGGRLINCYAEKAPDGSRSKIIIRRAPGLVDAFIAGSGEHRGSLLVGNTLYVINGADALSVTVSGGVYTVTQLIGSVPGSGPVIMARNMRAPTPQVLFTHSEGMSEIDITGGTVVDFSDPDLPFINSIAFLDGYFILTAEDGRSFASGLNDTTFNELDYGTAEARPDPLYRGIALNRDMLLMGANTIEFWANQSAPEGYPLTRGHVMTLGLFGRYAVAGYEYGFPGVLIWVANDRAVYKLDGYSPVRISTPHLDRLIEQIADPDSLRASVYVAAGHACWVLSSPTWTWVYDTSTGGWHERQTINDTKWMAEGTAAAFDMWFAFSRVDGSAYLITDRERREASGPLVAEARSIQMHSFPARTNIPRASFDFMTGVGIDTGIDPIETRPQVAISWSDDGGRSFGNPLLRSLGSQGETVSIDIYRCGLTQRLGRQWRWQVSDPVEVSFMGASMEVGR